VVSSTDPYSSVHGFLDQSCYFYFKAAPHEAEWTQFQTQYFSNNLVAPGVDPGPLDLQPGTQITKPKRWSIYIYMLEDRGFDSR
jgi:hypothetical protein